MPTVGPDSLDKSSELKLSHGRALTMICARGESFAHSTQTHSHSETHTYICICCQGQTHTLVGNAEGKGNRKGYGNGHRWDVFAPEILLTVVAYYHTAVFPGACSVIARHLSHGIKEQAQLERQLRAHGGPKNQRQLEMLNSRARKECLKRVCRCRKLQLLVEQSLIVLSQLWVPSCGINTK